MTTSLKTSLLIALFAFGTIAVPTSAKLSVPDDSPKFTINQVYKDSDSATIDFTTSNITTGGFVTMYYKRAGQHAYLNNHVGGSSDTSITNLVPNTRYYYYVHIEAGNDFTSHIHKFKTRATPYARIDSFSPTTVSAGDTLTIHGQGFGPSGAVKIGYSQDTISADSWSDDTVTVTVPANQTDGPIHLELQRYDSSGPGARYYYHKEIISAADVNVLNESHVYRDMCYAGIVANTYEAVKNVNDLYRIEFGRNANCDELTFQVGHNTSLDTLRAWLNVQEHGQWWDELTTTYNGKTFYGDNKTIYFMQSGTLYIIPNLMTAIAWGLIPDDAEYTDLVNLDDGDKRGYALDAATTLKFWEGPYYQDMLNFTNGDAADFDEGRIQTYVTNHADLFTKDGEDDSSNVCSYVACGLLY